MSSVRQNGCNDVRNLFISTKLNLFFVLRKYEHCTALIWSTDYELRGHAVAYLVEALCYKPEGRGFESR
jgi:hypothetical protein